MQAALLNVMMMGDRYARANGDEFSPLPFYCTISLFVPLFFASLLSSLYQTEERERERHDNWKEFLWQHGAWRPIFINAWCHSSTRRRRAKRRSNSHHRRHAQSIHRWNKTVQWLTVASKRLPAGHRHTVATTTSAPATGPDGWTLLSYCTTNNTAHYRKRM